MMALIKYNIVHFISGNFFSYNVEQNILEIFLYLHFFQRFLQMKNWQSSVSKITDWYLDFSTNFYIKLKSIIFSFKICFQNHGQVKRKIFRS